MDGGHRGPHPHQQPVTPARHQSDAGRRQSRARAGDWRSAFAWLVSVDPVAHNRIRLGWAYDLQTGKAAVAMADAKGTPHHLWPPDAVALFREAAFDPEAFRVAHSCGKGVLAFWWS